MAQGLVYTLNFSTPFKTSDNFSEVLSTITSVVGASNNIAPVYYDGALFANDGEFLSYGGLLRGSVAFSPPDGDESLGYERYAYGGADRKFSPGFIQKTISKGTTRYVAYGGGVNVPSENKGYYFGGMQAKGRGPVYIPRLNDTTDPTVYSQKLISVDMSVQLLETWKNESIVAQVPSRANPEVVWVPIGKNGVLVVIGGVVNPVYANASLSLTDAQKAESVGSPLLAHIHIPQF